MIRGSCLCDAVAFEIDGDLTPIQNCHATRCRKATGAAASPEMLARSEDLRWVRGEERIQVYVAPLLEEPPAYRKAFCQVCGSPLPMPIEGTPFTMVNAGILDDDPGTREFRHAFVAQRASWHKITDDLPSFDGQPPAPGEDETAR